MISLARRPLGHCSLKKKIKFEDPKEREVKEKDVFFFRFADYGTKMASSTIDQLRRGQQWPRGRERERDERRAPRAEHIVCSAWRAARDVEARGARGEVGETRRRGEAVQSREKRQGVNRHARSEARRGRQARRRADEQAIQPEHVTC